MLTVQGLIAWLEKEAARADDTASFLANRRFNTHAANRLHGAEEAYNRVIEYVRAAASSLADPKDIVVPFAADPDKPDCPVCNAYLQIHEKRPAKCWRCETPITWVST